MGHVSPPCPWLSCCNLFFEPHCLSCPGSGTGGGGVSPAGIESRVGLPSCHFHERSLSLKIGFLGRTENRVPWEEKNRVPWEEKNRVPWEVCKNGFLYIPPVKTNEPLAFTHTARARNRESGSKHTLAKYIVLHTVHTITYCSYYYILFIL